VTTQQIFFSDKSLPHFFLKNVNLQLVREHGRENLFRGVSLYCVLNMAVQAEQHHLFLFQLTHICHSGPKGQILVYFTIFIWQLSSVVWPVCLLLT